MTRSYAKNHAVLIRNADGSFDLDFSFGFARQILYDLDDAMWEIAEDEECNARIAISKVNFLEVSESEE